MRRHNIFLRSYRLLGTAPRFVLAPLDSPASSGRRIAIVNAPLSRVYAYHFELGPIPISESPHVRFVRETLQLSLSKHEKEAESWQGYISRQHGLSNSELEQWEKHFRKIIQEVATNQRWELPDIRLRTNQAILVDGFHRCAVAFALNNRCRVKVWING